MDIPQRKIKLSFKLAQNTGTNQPSKFVGTNADTVAVEKLRMIVRISNAQSPVATADVQIFGLDQSLMNELSTLGMAVNIIRKNTILIEAGDDESGMSTVFQGTVLNAYADYASQPDVPFHITALPGLFNATAPAQPSSFTGAASVESIIQGLASKMGYGFKNNGVSAQLSNSYFPGSYWEQVQRCADDAGIRWGIISNNLEIWPVGASRQQTNVPTISPVSGMIAYPSFTQAGIVVSTVYRPDLTFGGLVKIESSLFGSLKTSQPQAQFPTQWSIYKMDLALDQEAPGGEWRATCYCRNPGSNSPVLPPAKP